MLRRKEPAFASSSSGIELFCKRRSWIRIQKGPSKIKRKIQLTKATVSALEMEVRHNLVSLVLLWTVKTTREKAGHFSKMCRGKSQSKSGKYNKQQLAVAKSYEEFGLFEETFYSTTFWTSQLNTCRPWRVIPTTKEQSHKRMLAVKSRLRERSFRFNEKSCTRNLLSVSLHSISKDGIETGTMYVKKI